MTDEMLSLARENQLKAGVENVEFLKGEIENIPLPDNSVDVIISNCVINLSADKDRVLREAFRVLKPGGRFAVSDIVVLGDIPADIRRNVELWAGCVAGALHQDEYRSKLLNAGFETVDIEPTRIYRGKAFRSLLSRANLGSESAISQAEGKFASAFIRAKNLRRRAVNRSAARNDVRCHDQASLQAPSNCLISSMVGTRPAAFTCPSIAKPGMASIWNFRISSIPVTFSISASRASSLTAVSAFEANVLHRGHPVPSI